MTKVYVVMGSTGEYSDRGEWPVMAYLDEVRAQEHVSNASQKAREIKATTEEWYNIEKGLNPFDVDMKMDYTGTFYYYLIVPLCQ